MRWNGESEGKGRERGRERGGIDINWYSIFYGQLVSLWVPLAMDHLHDGWCRLNEIFNSYGLLLEHIVVGLLMQMKTIKHRYQTWEQLWTAIEGIWTVFRVRGYIIPGFPFSSVFSNLETSSVGKFWLESFVKLLKININSPNSETYFLFFETKNVLP